MKKIIIFIFIIVLSSCIFADNNEIVSNKTSSLSKNYVAKTPLGSINVDGSVTGPAVVQNSDGSYNYIKPNYNYSINMNPNLSANYFKHSKTKYYKPNQTGDYSGNLQSLRPNKSVYYTGVDTFGKKNNGVKPKESIYNSGNYKAHKQQSKGLYNSSKPNYKKTYTKTKYRKTKDLF